MERVSTESMNYPIRPKLYFLFADGRCRHSKGISTSASQSWQQSSLKQPSRAEKETIQNLHFLHWCSKTMQTKTLITIPKIQFSPLLGLIWQLSTNQTNEFSWEIANPTWCPWATWDYWLANPIFLPCPLVLTTISIFMLHFWHLLGSSAQEETFSTHKVLEKKVVSLKKGSHH